MRGNPPPLATTVREYTERGTPLFTFAQVGALLDIHQRVWTKLNTLTWTPEAYATLRNDLLTCLRKHAKQTGAPKFCENPECPALVPLKHSIWELEGEPPTQEGEEVSMKEKLVYKRYCSERCKDARRRASNPKRKSTDRVARSLVSEEILSLPLPD